MRDLHGAFLCCFALTLVAGCGSSKSDSAVHTGGAGDSAGANSAGASASAGGAAPADGGASGGPPGNAQHTVGACDKLGAVDALEEITPPGVTSSLDVQIDPSNAGTLYLGTDKTGIFKSTDCGSTWAKISTGRNSDVISSGMNWFLIISPSDPKTIYSAALYGTDPSMLKSVNGGVDWDSVSPAGSNVATQVMYNFFQWGAMDPKDSRHLFVSYHADCSGPTGPMCMGESKDSGATWRLFKGPLGMWTEQSSPTILDTNTWLFATYNSGIFYTADAGANWEKVGPGGYTQIYKRPSDGAYFMSSAFGLQESTDGGHTWAAAADAPKATAIIGDGKRMFAGEADPSTAGQAILTSPEASDPPTWTPMMTGKMASGPGFFAYDKDHHILYSSNTTGGVWRMVTQ